MKTKFRILLSSITFIAGVALLFAAPALPLRLAAQEKQNARLPQYTVTDLGTLGGTFSYAIGLNNRGWAGGAATLSGDTAQHAVLWAKGKEIDLGTFGGPNSGLFGPGINEKGQVVANAETDMEDHLGNLGGTTDNVATGINNLGQIVGQSGLPGQQENTDAFLWQNGVMTDLGTLAGDVGSSASNINDKGQVVGISCNTNTCRAFLAAV